MLAVEYIQAVLGNGKDYFGLKVTNNLLLLYCDALVLSLSKIVKFSIYLLAEGEDWIILSSFVVSTFL